MKRLLAVLAILMAGSTVRAQHAHDLHWIIGTWQTVDPSGITTERWEMKDSTTFVGTGTVTQNGVVVFKEDLRLEFREEAVTYVAVLTDRTAYFKLTELDAESAIFEDPENDFPSKIVYRTMEGKMNITLSGTENGKPHEMDMILSRK